MAGSNRISIGGETSLIPYESHQSAIVGFFKIATSAAFDPTTKSGWMNGVFQKVYFGSDDRKTTPVKWIPFDHGLATYHACWPIKQAILEH